MPIDPAVEAAALPGRDHNNPPALILTVSKPEDITPYLQEAHKPIIDRYAELLASATAMPASVDDDVTLGKAGDLIKEIRLWHKRADGARDIENEPFSKGKATVDSFFKNMIDPMKKWKSDIEDRGEKYKIARAAKKKAAEEAALKAQQEEAKRLADEAARAEERKRAAEEARETADAAAREARDNKDELEAGRLNAEAELAQAKLRKANARRDRDEPAFEQAGKDIIEAQAKLDQAKADLRAARTAQTEALAAAKRATDEAAKKSKEAAVTTGDAVVAEGRSDKMARKIESTSDGDRARERGEAGSVGTLARRWRAHITDMEEVKKNIALLLPFIDPDVLRVAINKRMATGSKDVPGVEYKHELEGLTV